MTRSVNLLYTGSGHMAIPNYVGLDQYCRNTVISRIVRRFVNFEKFHVDMKH